MNKYIHTLSRVWEDHPHFLGLSCSNPKFGRQNPIFGVPVVAQTDPSCQVDWTICASSGDPLYPLKTQNRGTCRRFYSLSFHIWLMISSILALKPRESHVFVSFMFKLSRMNITVDVLPPYLGEKPGFPSKLSPLLTTCQVRHGLSPMRLSWWT